jgi:hypothetical protein
MQNRLDIFTRKISAEEEEHRRRIEAARHELKELQKSIKQRRRELTQRQEIQQRDGKQPGEIEITAEAIDERLQPMRDRIRRIESDIKDMINQSAKLQKSANKQTDIFS